jgi:hypothetical protein
MMTRFRYSAILFSRALRTLFEEVLKRELENYGNVETVADPRRLMPLPGASRQHLGPDWQAVVRKRIESVDLVLLIMGRLDTHPGLRWELEALSTMSRPIRHALLLPPTLRKEERAIRWNQYNVYFSGELGTFEGSEIAVAWDSGGSSSVIRFVPDTENDLGLVFITLRAYLGLQERIVAVRSNVVQRILGAVIGGGTAGVLGYFVGLAVTVSERAVWFFAVGAAVLGGALFAHVAARMRL